MWPLRAKMWLHGKNGQHTRAEEQRQPDRRGGRGRRDDHGHPAGQAGSNDRLLDDLARNGAPDRRRNGSAGQRQAPRAETDQTSRAWADGSGVRLRRPPLSLYLDTSALIKLLVDEPDSDLAREAYRNADASATSAITYLEATAALGRLEKGKRISSKEFADGLTELDVYWAELRIHSVNDNVIQAASAAALDHRLRAYDSLHLATARAFAEVESGAFACWDRELRAAARECGFTLVPEQL
jgi:uncharacterized protein